MKKSLISWLASALVLCAMPAMANVLGPAPKGPAPLSPQSQACISCHKKITPGIVQDWQASAHAMTTPAEALEKPPLERMFSAASAPTGLSNTVVSCYECHGDNPGAHKDTFEHFGFKIHVVVTPGDCARCHPAEVSQFEKSKMSYAYSNLVDNPLYHTLTDTVIGPKTISDISDDGGRITIKSPSGSVAGNTCFGCHGMPITVNGLKKISTSMGEIEVPNIINWPNMGIGRVNPDGTRGTCSACHPGHSFSIAIARRPYACAQCHTGADSPAWNVYAESAHGNIFLSEGSGWNFTHVPWRPGIDFKAPTCAACHSSLLAGPDGKVIVQRTHDFGSRLWVRLFGLIYSTPEPKSGDTSLIMNKDGLPLPVSFSGKPASKYLIGKDEQERREAAMKSICNSCHSSDWTDGYFKKMDATIKAADGMTAAATKLMDEAWREGVADKTNPFDQHIEMDWVKQWLFYANTVKYAAAMSAPYYTSFKDGFWDLSYNLRKMKDEIEIARELKAINTRAIQVPPAAERRLAVRREIVRKRIVRRKIVHRRIIHRKIVHKRIIRKKIIRKRTAGRKRKIVHKKEIRRKRT